MLSQFLVPSSWFRVDPTRNSKPRNYEETLGSLNFAQPVADNSRLGTRNPRLIDSLRYSHPRGPEHVITPPVTSLHFFCDCAQLDILALDRANGIMQLGVKSLAQALQWGYALRFQ